MADARSWALRLDY